MLEHGNRIDPAVLRRRVDRRNIVVEVADVDAVGTSFEEKMGGLDYVQRRWSFETEVIEGACAKLQCLRGSMRGALAAALYGKVHPALRPLRKRRHQANPASIGLVLLLVYTRVGVG